MSKSPSWQTIALFPNMGVGREGVSFYLLEGEAAKYFPDIEKSREYINIEICPWHLHKLSTILNDLVFHRAQLSISDFKQALFWEISKTSSDMHDVFSKWNRTKAFRIVKKKKMLVS